MPVLAVDDHPLATALGAGEPLEPRGLDLCCALPRPAGHRALDALFAPASGGGRRARPDDDGSATGYVRQELDRRRGRLRDDLPLLQELSVKVARRHGARAPILYGVREAVAELVALLDAHLVRGESLLPLLRLDGKPAPAERIERFLADSEGDREQVVTLLERLRCLTDGGSTPAWACLGLRQLYALLAELEEEALDHLRLERRLLALLAHAGAA